MKDITVIFAETKDEGSIKNLLLGASLPHEDISKHLNNFLLAKSNDTLVGVVGLELLGESGLLRSLAVASPHRGKGIGKMLYERILAYAHLQKINELYLLTTTAEEYFSKLGFSKVERNSIPKPIQSTAEFHSLCPSTAVCMLKKIGMEAQYYPRDMLSLQPDVPGSKMWGIALEKTMLTYFEVQPNCRFEKHEHESEQITLVLEGELFFETDEKTVGVKEGEVIALPSGIPHAVFTQEKFVKAVDAWSPVMEKYK
jgi:amino-acid N-acetyltransferase